MADRYLLVPGTGGVDFKRDDGRVASYILVILTGSLGGRDSKVADELSCEHPADSVAPFAPTRTSLLPGVSLQPYQVLRGTAYNKVEGKYEDFAYDWRLDIRHNARRLLEHLRENRGSGRQRWRLLAHSQGGLVVLAASKLCDSPREFATLVSKIALVGCPVFGTMSAAKAMLEGSNFGGVASDFFKTASRTWPSLCQMLPVYESVRGRPGWTGLAAPLWQNEPKLANSLSRARQFRSWLHAGGLASHLDGDIDLRLYFGSHHDTVFRFDVPADDAPPKASKEEQPGDALVPYRPTLVALNREGLRSYARLLSGGSVSEHMSLLNDGRVYSIVDAFLEG